MVRVIPTIPYWAPFVGSSALIAVAVMSGQWTTLMLVLSLACVEVLPILLLWQFATSVERENVKLFSLGLNAAVLLAFAFLVEFELALALIAGFWLPLLVYFLVVTLVPSADSVVDGLWVGNAAAARNVALLKRHRVTHVLELHDGQQAQPPSAPPGDVVAHTALLYRPADDVAAVLDDAVRFITQARKAKGNVLVACHTGITRSPIVAAAYLVRAHSYTVKDAVTTVLKRRALADPSLRLQMRLRELHPLHDFDSPSKVNTD
jgi:atypical dual specificity phosphatase